MLICHQLAEGSFAVSALSVQLLVASATKACIPLVAFRGSAAAFAACPGSLMTVDLCSCQCFAVTLLYGAVQA